MREESFQPIPLLWGAHGQTIVAALLNLHKEPPSKTKIVAVADNDKIALEISEPEGWKETDETVVLIHGLTGSHLSPYLVRLAGRLYNEGVRAVRMNLRGAGTGQGLARRLYHSGMSPDLHAVLESLKEEQPHSPISIMSFSLGGNIALNWAGEQGHMAEGIVEQLIAVCPPIDLLAASRMLALPENKVYERHFMKHLKQFVAIRHAIFPDLPRPNAGDLPEPLSMFLFDNIYTSAHGNFKDAQDYYARTSPSPVIGNIKIPTIILFACDDPFINAGVMEAIKAPPNVEVVRTEHGGHLGFLANPAYHRDVYWMDGRLMEWYREKRIIK